ncbi:MAG: hypothetical protein ACRDYU_13260 [Actinomycetes bacterium]
MTGGPPEDHLSVSEEAARLFAALQSRLGSSSGDCRFCPLCQAASALRQTRPEVAEHLLGAASELVEAWRAALDPHGADGDQAQDRSTEPDDGEHATGSHGTPGASRETPDASREPPPGNTERPRGPGRGIEHIEVR